MKEESPDRLTIVLTGSKGSCAFRRGTCSWHFDNGTPPHTFKQLKAKNPDPCCDVLRKLLDSHDHLLLRAHYDGRPGKALLTAIRSDLKTVFDRLFEMIGYEGTDPIVMRRGDGYELLSEFVANSPDWLLGGNLGTGKRWSTESHRASLGLPRLLWAEALVGLVAEGRSAYVGVLPGNGLEQVQSILSETLHNAHIIKVDLTWLDNRDQLLKEIANQADGAEASVIKTDRLDNLLHLVRAVRGSRDQLGIVVNGLGLFAGNARMLELKEVARLLHGLSKVDSGHVALVVPSPTEPHHFLPYNTVGSFLTDLAPVFLRPSDLDSIRKWAVEKLENTTADEVEDLMKHAADQLGALQVAMLDSQGNHQDRLIAIRHAHYKAGLQILNAVGPCCRRVLIGSSRNPDCQAALREAHILDEGNRAVITTWTASWRRARRRR